MPTKKDSTQSSAGRRTTGKKTESNQLSATRVASKTHAEKKTSSTPATARVNAGHKDPAPPAIRKPTPKQVGATPRPTRTAAETTSSATPSQARVQARQDDATVPEKPARASKPAASAPPAAAPPPQAEPAVIDKAAAPVTRISAHADIGHGNVLFLRGEGSGLSWDTGVAMNNDGDNQWFWAVASTHEHITFKFLINDQMWSAGDNLTVAQGETSLSTPSF